MNINTVTGRPMVLAQSGITCLQVDSDVQTDVINELTTDAGVTVDGVLIKDGLVDGVDVASLSPDVSGAVQLGGANNFTAINTFAQGLRSPLTLVYSYHTKTINQNVLTKIDFNPTATIISTYDARGVNGFYDSVNNVITLPWGGLYHVCANFSISVGINGKTSDQDTYVTIQLY